MPQEFGLPSRKLGYTFAEAVALTGVSRSQLYQERKAGRLKVVKVGRRALITHTDLEAWIELLRTTA
jgi:excisionase family DNA binding protein